MAGPTRQDEGISRQVEQKIANRGLRSPCRVTVKTLNGEVTLSGIVQFAHQKMSAANAINGLAGVKRVVNQLIVKPVDKRT